MSPRRSRGDDGAACGAILVPLGCAGGTAIVRSGMQQNPGRFGDSRVTGSWVSHPRPTSARRTSRPRSVSGVNGSNNVSGAGRTPQPSPPPVPKTSFARRHPFYAAFGVLAALSLFSAFWPVSALITGAVVAARATGADRLAGRVLVRGARWIRVKVAGNPLPPEAPAPADAPPGAPDLSVDTAVHHRAPALRSPAVRTHRTRSAAHDVEPVTAGKPERESGTPGL